MDALSEISESEVVQYVMEIVHGKYLKSQEHLILAEKMTAFYKSQNIVELYKLIDQDTSVVFEKKENILDKRNLNWLPKIEASSKKNAVFYAVGAAHLAGEKGLIQLLKNAGYMLRPIFSELQKMENNE